MASFKGIVSPDDHLVEPADLWQSRLPQRYRGIGPRVIRERGRADWSNGYFSYVNDDTAKLVDVWYYEDMRVATTMPGAAVGYDLDDIKLQLMTFDEMRPGCFQQGARLDDMDTAGIEASLCFPNLFVRFCGQRFLWAKDKELALLCVKAYNDYVLDEWTSGSDGRLIPLGILPLWDVNECVREVERVAARGMHAVCFSELPARLDLPSIHSDHWDPLLAACEAASTVIMIHIGSSSGLPVTSEDAPAAVLTTLPAVNSAMAMIDWLFSGAFLRFPNLKIGLAETQAGWVPYFLQRADDVWREHRGWDGLTTPLPNPPSSYFRDHIFVSTFRDPVAMRNIDLIGEGNVMFETDYPHNDTSWPNSLEQGKEATSDLAPETAESVLRGNALRLFGLES